MEVSIMFTDIKDFTLLVEKLEPDETVRMLNEVLTFSMDAVQAESGLCDKFIGDSMSTSALRLVS